MEDPQINSRSHSWFRNRFHWLTVATRIVVYLFTIGPCDPRVSFWAIAIVGCILWVDYCRNLLFFLESDCAVESMIRTDELAG